MKPLSAEHYKYVHSHLVSVIKEDDLKKKNEIYSQLGLMRDEVKHLVAEAEDDCPLLLDGENNIKCAEHLDDYDNDCLGCLWMSAIGNIDSLIGHTSPQLDWL